MSTLIESEVARRIFQGPVTVIACSDLSILMHLKMQKKVNLLAGIHLESTQSIRTLTKKDLNFLTEKMSYQNGLALPVVTLPPLHWLLTPSFFHHARPKP